MVTPRILIVEDNILIVDEVASFLHSYGYAVAGAASSIDSGLEIIEGGRIDGALVDIDLAGQSSIPICRALQAKSMPFAFLTGYSRHPVLSEFHEAPYVAKPPDAPHLLAALRSVLPSDEAEFGNAVLDRLPTSHPKLWAALERVPLVEGDVLGSTYQPCSHAYFPIDALISVRYGQPGHRVEVAHVGHRSAVSFAAFRAADSVQAMVLIGGEAWRVPEAILQQITEQDAISRRHLADPVAAMLRQAMETAMFDARASVIQRVAHWLMRASEETGASRLTLTHDAMAETMGVRRASVTVALHELEGEGMVRSKRGLVVILDRERLGALVSPLQARDE